LALEQTLVDFGCVVNETNKRQIVTMTNTSRVPAVYNWTLVIDEAKKVADAKEAARAGHPIPAASDNTAEPRKQFFLSSSLFSFNLFS
jgi:hypothetical protein